MRALPDFLTQLSFLPTDQGGRAKPVRSGYRPMITFENYPEYLTTGEQTYLDKEEVLPGQIVQAEIKILGKEYFTGRLYEGMHFRFSEGSVVIGHGEILEIRNPALSKTIAAEENTYNLNLFSSDILERIFSDFGNGSALVIQAMQVFLMANEAFRSERLVRCIIYLADKKVDGIKKGIKDARTDWRDVLMAAEYENSKDSQPKRVRDFSRRFGKEQI
jgi:hypothetical protein